LHAADKLELEKQGGLYSTARPEHQLVLDRRYAHRRAEVERGVDTYWLSQPLQTGVGNKQSLYLEGGDEFVRYGANFGYFKNKGVMKGSDRNSFEGGMSLSYRRNDLLIRNQLNVSSNISNNSPYGSFGDFSRLNPYWNPYDENGQVKKILETIEGLGVSGTSYIVNPMYNALIGTANFGKYSGMNNNTFVEWRATPALRFTAKIGISSQKDESNVFLPADHTVFADISDYNSSEYNNRGSYNRNNSGFFSYDGSLVSDYNRMIDKHQIFATLGFSLAEQQSKSSGIVVRGFPNNRLDEIFYGNGYLENSRPQGANNISRRFSSFANFNYTYDRRFLFDLALNVDGSTQFGELNRYAPFWATGLGWNLHEENFMRDKLGFFNRFKIRAGLGTTGSQQFPPYMAITTYIYNTGQDYLGMYGAQVRGYGNRDLKWQETLKFNLGSDVVMWDDRINLRLDFYYEATENLLLDINTPPSLGMTSYKENMGSLRNRGVEGNLNFFIFKPATSRFSWSMFVNGIHNKNEIKEISNALKKMNENNDQNEQTKPQVRYQEGQSVNAIWAVRSAGIDPSTGKEVFYDRDGNLTYVWNAQDKIIVGDAIPKLNGNLGTSITYRGFQLGASFSYQIGARQYNQTLADYVENANIALNVDERVFLDRWKQPGDNTFFKGLTDVEGNTVTSVTNATSRFMQKNNFLNFTSISLGYMLPDRLAAKLYLKNTRFSLQGNDILQLSTIQVERGLSYPFARNFTFGLSTSF
jgi:TonB-linked SusC/RagA family outer membrane protein